MSNLQKEINRRRTFAIIPSLPLDEKETVLKTNIPPLYNKIF